MELFPPLQRDSRTLPYKLGQVLRLTTNQSLEEGKRPEAPSLSPSSHEKPKMSPLAGLYGLESREQQKEHS